MPGRRPRKVIEQFYKSLSIRSQLKLYTAIFFMFGPVGLLSTSSFAEQGAWWTLLSHVLISGLVAVGCTLSAIRDLRLLIIVIPVNLVAFTLIKQYRPTRPSLEGIACVALIVLGYLFFISFVNSEGAKSVRLQTEISLAQDIHRNLVPQINFATPRFEFFGRSVPSSEFGGDLIDVVECRGRYVLFIADVSGHGVPAGVLMAMVKSAIRMKLVDEQVDSLFEKLNQVLYQLGYQGMFVTCACADIGSSFASCATAAHVPILHYDASEGLLRRLSKPSLPLGIFQRERAAEDHSYEWQEFDFGSGDLLVLVTDGLTEVLDGNDQELGLEALEALIKENRHMGLPELYQAMVSAARQHGPQHDDETVLLARCLQRVSSNQM